MEREMLLAKVNNDPEKHGDLIALAESVRSKIVDDVEGSHMILELTGQADKLDDFLELLDPFGIIEMTRTGPVGMRRGIKGFTVD
jgi:acetolactate synthase-1/3 small subunit